MGAIADAIVEFAQPLIDATDGSMEQVNHALATSQLCWNLALLPADKLDQSLREMRPKIPMDDAEFDSFRRGVLDPMIRRHRQMFPLLHEQSLADRSPGDLVPRTYPDGARRTEKYPGTDPYALCPCNSGRKYKFCCRATPR